MISGQNVGSSCLELEADAADAPEPAAAAPLALAPGSLLGGRPLLAAEAHEDGAPPAAPAEAPAAEGAADTPDDWRAPAPLVGCCCGCTGFGPFPEDRQ